MKKDAPLNLHCVYDTMAFIEKNYDQDISVRELESLSHYSYRNIQRIFKYTCGETIGAYQKRLRVENAYKMILYTNDLVSAIGLKVGFANPASFSKAFKQQFGIGPKDARQQKSPLLAKAEIFPIAAEQWLQPDLVYVPPVTIYYKSAFIRYIHDDIESLWSAFMQNDFPAYGNDFYGIVADEPLIREQLNCRYDAGSLLPARNRNLPSKTIGGGRYAQFVHYGTYETIEETYKNIYSGWILEAALEFGHTPVIEKYLRHPDNTDAAEGQITYILLPLA